MTEFNTQQFGKLLTLIGLIIMLFGGIIILLGHLGLFKLPGDLEIGSKNWRFYLPITTSIVISIILTFIFWLISLFRR